MEPNARLNLVAAAATAVGPMEDPSGWRAEVRQKAVDLFLMAGERGEVGRALQQLAECRTYVATIRGGKVEKHTLDDGGELRRGLVKFAVPPSKYNDTGIEEVRTELLSTPDGAALWQRIKQLSGHRVLVYAQTEEKERGKVKTLRHIEDLGTVQPGDE